MFCPGAALLTRWNGKKLHKVTIVAETLRVFPDSDSVKKRWRECLAVCLDHEEKGGIVWS